MMTMRCKMVNGESMSYLLSDTKCFRDLHAAMGGLSLFVGLMTFGASFYYMILIHETPLGFDNPQSVVNTFPNVVFTVIRTLFTVVFIAMSNVTFLMILGME